MYVYIYVYVFVYNVLFYNKAFCFTLLEAYCLYVNIYTMNKQVNENKQRKFLRSTGTYANKVDEGMYAVLIYHLL
jgi:hypothetical protein